MSAESYIGVTLLDNYGNPLGLLALIDTSPFGDTTQAEYLMNIFSTRAAMELERLRAEKEREKLIKDLQTTLDEIKTLRGILPICSYCKKIRDDQGAWDRVEAYICAHSEVEFSHGICPECYQKYENGDFD